jgi:hypothetical protein
LRLKFQTTAIFGSDGDLPPSFAEQLAAKVGKTIDKNYIDTRRPPPVRCVWMPCDSLRTRLVRKAFAADV